MPLSCEEALEDFQNKGVIDVALNSIYHFGDLSIFKAETQDRMRIGGIRVVPWWAARVPTLE